jgi:sulfate transport system substrate-binding protein
MSRLSFTGFSLLATVILAFGQAGCGSNASGKPVGSGSVPQELELLNVSYDPTRELWKDINEQFIPVYEKEANVKLSIKQSHGGSGSQARAVADGLEADVVTLATWGDTEAIRKAGLIKDGWKDRLPNGSLPYSSTIVFVVRKGNPKGVKDWSDLVKEGIAIITPNPKTSANGKLSFLAAWGSVVTKGGSEDDALKFVTQLYKQVPVLDSGARGATTTFAQKGIGDVHLTWENEAHLEIKEAKGALEIVYPSTSVLAEPRVAVVDGNVDRRGTRAAAEAYLEYLYTKAGQETIAKHFYRPTDPDVLKASAQQFPEIKLFPVTALAESWEASDKKFFSEGGIFDGIYSSKK